MFSPALESEREIVATIAASPHLLRSVGLSGAEFHGHAKLAWEAAKRLDAAGALSGAALFDALTVEGRAYLSQALADSLSATWHLDGHVAQVLDRFRCSELARLGSQLIEHAGDSRTADEILAEHTADLTELGKSAGSSGLRGAGDVALAELERIESGEDERGVGLGLSFFDGEVGGTVGGEMCIVAARPGMGKTALLVQGAEHAIERDKCAVLFVSAEMPSRLLMWRFLARRARVSVSAFRKRSFDAQEWRRAYDAMAWFKRQPFDVLDKIPSIATLWSEVHRWAAKHHGKRLALYVDYLQRLPIRQQRGETRNDAIGAVSWGFAELAKLYNMPVVMAAQLNRAVEQQDRKPQMSDLRDSGNIEQDASQIIFPWRPDVYGDPTKAELIIAKNRNGEAGICRDMVFEPQTGRFYEYQEQQQSPGHWAER